MSEKKLTINKQTVFWSPPETKAKKWYADIPTDKTGEEYIESLAKYWLEYSRNYPKYSYGFGELKTLEEAKKCFELVDLPKPDSWPKFNIGDKISTKYKSVGTITDTRWGYKGWQHVTTNIAHTGEFVNEASMETYWKAQKVD